MGQKTHPIGFRLGITKDWFSRWFDDKRMADKLHEDITIKDYLKTRLRDGWISRIEIERTSKKLRVIIYTARPGIVIGKGGEQADSLKAEITALVGRQPQIDVREVKFPELDAQLVAFNIARQIERRISYRRAMKRAVQNAMRLGAGGIRVQCSGRLGGAEIARKEWYREGRVPLHTLRADIDYATDTAVTTAGTVGVKVWIFKGEA
ncbi:30S ribosomal protein S3 [bacterium]|uniref:Small ribosomal subunit protein uS3 n=1 Tax=candidate division WOR-3 bacterium TaxID=2052148 RepID=A0A7C0V9M3_UNCW3|nr:MAG: 30S ribosomal protein S3 [bacterium]RKZ22472.1 MAG: 30S ribosomal protein S3 [bacterium]HDI82396.1 30S ribosomal protein S3 [candidate division WOR-3 bacterium]